MKLLLTSGGITNSSIAQALLDLTGKKFSELKLVFIPTAANVKDEDKSWLIQNFSECKALGFSFIDIVDIAAIPKNLWLPRLKKADVLLFGGGNTFYLMHWIKKSGLQKLLPGLLKTRVYVGISAGSIVPAKSLAASHSKKLYYTKDVVDQYDDIGLGFVDFHVRPHFNSSYFTKVNPEFLQKLAREVPEPVYGIDDQTALKVVDGNVTVVSEGTWKKFN